MVKKRCFLLIEMLIALSMITAIFTVLFYSYSKIILTEKKLAKAKNAVFQRQYLQMKVADMITNLAKGPDEKYFYKKQNNGQTKLTFYFDNHIDPNPDYSGVIKASLFVKDSKLFLKQTPLNNKKQERIQILLDQINLFDIICFDERTTPKKSAQDLLYIEKTQWPKQMNHYPLAFQMQLLQDKQKFNFAFFLPIKQDASER